MRLGGGGVIRTIVGGGGGFTPCTGTSYNFPQPTDFQDGVWSANSATATGRTNPDPIGGNNATGLISNGGAFPIILRPNPVGLTATAAQTYVLTGYFNPAVAPNWLVVSLSDEIANSFGAYFDLANAVVGLASGDTGDGHTTCSSIRTDSFGYVYLTMAGHFDSTRTVSFQLLMAKADGDLTSTLNQEFYAYAVEL